MTDTFPTDTAGLQDAAQSETVELSDGAQFRLSITPVRKRLGDPGFALDDDTLVVCERFRVVAPLPAHSPG